MNNRPVIFIDSGIGGIPYCRAFAGRNPHEAVCYLADRENYPYGPHGKDDLISILIALTEKLINFTDPKIVVLACNSATVSAVAALRQVFPQLPFVGTVPAIKPAVNASVNRKIGVLGTERTIGDSYNQSLAANSGFPVDVFGVAAPELVDFVEHRFEKADDNEKTEIVRKYLEIFRNEGVDTLVLGCTHFLHLIDIFRQEAGVSIKVFDSLEGITKRIEYLLDKDNGELRACKDMPSGTAFRWLLLTGKEPADSLWKKRANALGFKLSLLNDL
ncbi:MAG: glutamate racemase [Treponema sp.]|nr:glutamate racemase [Treponema sp.]